MKKQRQVFGLWGFILLAFQSFAQSVTIAPSTNAPTSNPYGRCSPTMTRYFAEFSVVSCYFRGLI